jgi:putative DNA primase/helicase
MDLTISNDGPVDIATGRSRKEANWKNKEWQWSDLVKKLSTTHRTAETYTEYLAAKKPRQDEIKDIGGFVGGYLTNGKRRTETVLHRQVLTMDLDFAKPGMWEDFKDIYGNAACIYSTHKHSPESPRLRLVMPLTRPVVADEYVAVSRKIAGYIGIEDFDPTGFRPTQFMYWPSTSKDGQFVFQYQDGPWLNPDEVLDSYHDWRDSSAWPTSERENTIAMRAIKKQGDPLEKPGIVGAFCRTYTIHEVIELFLPGVYEATDLDGRYTYKEGTTAAGLITYDDKFAFSHHGTDPVSGKLCNAFDLVRLHRFGLKDEDAREGTPINKMPSYVAMQDMATQDVKVKKQLGNDRLAEARDDFADMVIKGVLDKVPTEEDSDWMAQLSVDRFKKYYPTIDNLVIILHNDPIFKGNICYDEFEQRAVIRRSLPWRKYTYGTRYMTDRDDHNIEHYLEKTYGIGTAKLEKALSVIYQRDAFHPVRDYLNGLTWDGEDRLETMLIDYMGAVDNDYTRAVTKKALVAAVARVFKPGIKFDYVLTLVGEEGKGKSTLFKKLGRHWFSDTFNLHMLQGKEAYEQIRGAWIIEIGELAGMAKAEVERVKGFISASEDRYRQAYGRRVENFPRQNVFFATTNKPDFLKSQTGNRRFWPVSIDPPAATKSVFKDLTPEEINQIWAQATHLFKEGETPYLPADLEREAIVVQKEYTEEHPWTGIIKEYLDKLLPENWATMSRYDRVAYLQNPDELQVAGRVLRTRACVLEIYQESGVGKRDAIDEISAGIIRTIMRNMPGWEEETKLIRYGIYGPQRRGFTRFKLPEDVDQKPVDFDDDFEDI